MGKNIGSILALIITLLATSNQAYSQDVDIDRNLNKQESMQVAKAVDIDKFKEDLEKVSDLNQSPIRKAKVKMLGSKYLLSPGDMISISVYGEPEFTQTDILVRPDGRATIEPFGELQVAGLSVNELTDNLKSNFKTYLLDPKVSVKLSEMHAAKVYIYGAVQKPGFYQQERVSNRDEASGSVSTVFPELSVASVISNAGGVKYNANLRNVQVINKELGKNEKVDLIKLIQEGDINQDIFLSSGDSIYVPYLETDAQISDSDFELISSSSIAPAEFPVRVIGAVIRPGVHVLTSASPRLNSAIAASEGYNIDANKKVVTVQRITPQGNVSTFYVDPNQNDIILRPNDLIVVSEKSTSVAGRGFEYFANVVTPFGRVSDAINSWAEVFDPTRRYEWPR